MLQSFQFRHQASTHFRHIGLVPWCKYTHARYQSKCRYLTCYTSIREYNNDFASNKDGTQPLSPEIKDFLNGINAYKSLYLNDDKDPITDTIPGIQSLPSEFTDPAIITSNSQSNTVTTNTSNIKHISKIIAHKGSMTNVNNPLMFLARFNNSSSNDRWFMYDVIKNVKFLDEYINSKQQLWRQQHGSPRSITINVQSPNAISRIFQHRKDKTTNNQHMIKVRYIDTKKPDEWLPLHDSNGITNNYLISSSVFQNYLSQTKDTIFFKSYTSNSIEYKLMMANFVTSNVNELISGDIDHHGLKYLDKGKPLRYLKAIQTDEKDIWIAKHSDELDRLINRRKIMRFIKQSDKEIGRTESYWNPQLTKKIKKNRRNRTRTGLRTTSLI